MVATLLRIRFRVLANTLMSSPWRLIGFIAGALWGLSILLFVTIGLVYLGFAAHDTAQLAIVAGGALLTLGWILAPVFAAGVDTTLDPSRLAQFPVTTSRMMVALTLAGVTGVPGIITSLAGLATLAAWARVPVALAASLICVPLGVLICIVASRTLAAVVGGLSGSRRAGEVLALIFFAALLLAGPIVAGLTTAAVDSFDRLEGIIRVISWTPIGAAWSVPGDLAAGDVLAALAKLGIAAATLAVLWLIWHRSLAASLVSPAARSRKALSAGKLGWFGRLPTGGTGATWARSLTYWQRDPRYLRQLLIVPVVPVLILFYAGGDATSIAMAFSATIVAFVIGIVPYADISYDGTAFGTVIATGVRGRDDRLGRMLAAGTIALPLVLIVAFATLAISREWSFLPPVLGSALGMLLTAYGVSAVSSAHLVIPVPASGDNPFKRVPGAGFGITLAFLGIWLLSAALAAPTIGLALWATIGGVPAAGWAALIVGIVMGLGVFIAGIVVGGRQLDRTAPDLLRRLKALKGV